MYIFDASSLQTRRIVIININISTVYSNKK